MYSRFGAKQFVDTYLNPLYFILYSFSDRLLLRKKIAHSGLVVRKREISLQ